MKVHWTEWLALAYVVLVVGGVIGIAFWGASSPC
jgi:hypothetical protein